MWAIALITLRRFQEPAFLVLLFIGCLVAYTTSGIGAMEMGMGGAGTSSLEPSGGMLVGTLVVAMLGALVGIFTGATEIPRDIASRMIAILLSKPISRYSYFVGKYLGCLMMAVSFTASCLIVMLISRAVDGNALSASDSINQFRCLLVIIPIVSMAVTISAYLPDIAAMVVTSGLVFLSFATALVPLIVSLAPPEIAKVILVGYFFVPNLGFFLSPPMAAIGEFALIVYAATIAWLFLLLGRTRFEAGDIF